MAEPESQLNSQLDTYTLDPIELPQAAIQTQILDLERFPLFLPASLGVRTADSDQPSAVRIGQPSLTWLQDQLNDRYRRDFYRRDRSYRDLYRSDDFLVEQWQAYLASGPDGKRIQYVDAIVNELVWDALRDFERYAVILQFGTEAQRYGYYLRVFHSGDAAIAVDDAITPGSAERVVWRGAYLCDPALSSPDETCEVVLNNAVRRTRPNTKIPDTMR